MESTAVPSAAHSRKLITAKSSCRLPVSTTGPISTRFSRGASSPTRVMASAAAPKPARSRVVRQLII